MIENTHLSGFMFSPPEALPTPQPVKQQLYSTTRRKFTEKHSPSRPSALAILNHHFLDVQMDLLRHVD